MSGRMIRIELKSFLQPIQGLVGSSSVKQKLTFKCVDSRIEWFEFSRAFYFGQRFRVPSGIRK